MKNNEFNVTRKMLKTIRSLTESKSSKTVITEEDNQDIYGNLSRNKTQENMKDDVAVINDVDIKLLSSDQNDMTLDDKQKEAISTIIDNFRQQVSQIVDFQPGFTISMNQIRLDGVLTDEDLSFVLIAGEEDGVYINAEMLKLEQSIGDVLEKLVKFQETFITSMEPLITQRSNN